MVRYNIILRIIEDYVEKCSRESPQGSSGIVYPKGEAPKFEPKGKKISVKELNEIADTMAERYGLEVSEVNGKREISEDKFILWDNNHKTELDFSEFIEFQSEIDFTNRGYYETPRGRTYESAYTLDEVLSYYNEMPVMMKDAMGGIIFKGHGGSYSTLHEGRIDNPIVMTHNFFSKSYGYKGGDNDVQRVMYHEGSHAIENMDYRKNGSTYIFSNTVGYHEGMKKNNMRFASSYGRTKYRDRIRHHKHRRHCEDFAETMSMVALSRSSNRNNSKIDNVQTVEEFKETHKGTWEYCESILDGKVKPKDLRTLY